VWGVIEEASNVIMEWTTSSHSTSVSRQAWLVSFDSLSSVFSDLFWSLSSLRSDLFTEPFYLIVFKILRINEGFNTCFNSSVYVVEEYIRADAY
jgi:hypothetical protein